MPNRGSGGITKATTHITLPSQLLHQGKFFTYPLYKLVKVERWHDKGHCGHLVGYGWDPEQTHLL